MSVTDTTTPDHNKQNSSPLDDAAENKQPEQEQAESIAADPSETPLSPSEETDKPAKKDKKTKKEATKQVESTADDSSATPLSPSEETDKPAKKAKKAKKASNKPRKIKNSVYEKELARLQIELVKLQEWIKHEGLKVVVIFEGRDAAGKGGVIKRITESLSPRICRVVALGTPTEREKTQWYFQRYVPHLPAAGEMALFDRSWYNRAGVERVMGFCTEEEYREFLRSCP